MILISGSLLISESCQLLKKKKADAESTGIHTRNNFDDFFIDACTHFTNGNYSLSIKNLEKCISLKPEEASVYYQLSKNYDELNNYELCLQNAMKAFNLSTSNLFYGLWYAEKLERNGQFATAIKILEKTNSLYPKDEQVIKAIDALMLKNKNPILDRINLWLSYKQASGYKLKTALKLIELYKQNNDFTAAHEQYAEIKKASPLKFQYYVDDGNLFLEQNDEVHAMENFQKALEINPKNYSLNSALFKLNADKNNKEAARLNLQNALSDPLNNFDTKLEICRFVNQKIQTDSSYGYYNTIIAEQLLSIYPNNQNALYLIADIYEQKQMYREALTVYMQLNTLSPGMYNAWMGTLKTSYATRQFKTCLDAAQNAIELYPNVATIYYYASSASNELKLYNQAFEFAASGISFAFDPFTKAQLLTEKGLANFNNQQYQAAELVLLEAIKLNDKDFKTYDILGNVYFKLNKSEMAMENWKKSKDLGNQSSSLIKKIHDGKYFEP